MNEDRAVDLAQRIVNSTNGWNDPAVIELVREIQTWRDPWCAEAAVEAICHGWTDPRRPTLGYIVKSYNEAMDAKRRREEQARPPSPPSGRIPTFTEGLEIARQAYREAYGREMTQATGAEGATRR